MGANDPNNAILDSYDMVMLPCEGTANRAVKTGQELSNLLQFANAGGRIYASHYSYAWLDEEFAGAAQWLWNSPVSGSSIALAENPGVATVDTSFSEGSTLGQWLQLPAINASVAPDQMDIFTLKRDTNGVIPPTQSWLTMDDPTYGNTVMQFVFNTPMGSTNQCGRVLYNEYHVENSNSGGAIFPSECNSSPTITPQEKLLEYSLFELTADGNAATLTPPTQDFGTGTVGFPLSTETFLWTNNSIFPATVTLLTASPGFTVGPNNCKDVPSQTSCPITVSFTPTAVGTEGGTLTVGAPGTTLTSGLTGTGTSGLSIVTTSMQFPSVDVGGSMTQTMLLTNIAPGSVPVPSLTTTGDYNVNSNCADPIPINTSCTLFVTFAPAATGLRTGSLMIGQASYSLVTALSGNGVDFSISVSPTSDDVVAGYGMTTSVTTTPIAGFNGIVTVSCNTNAGGSTCTVSRPLFILAAASTSPVVITTTSQYTVVGYGGAGGSGWLWLIAVGSACLLWMKRRRSSLAQAGVMMLLLVAAFSFTGCSGKYPDQNNPYTAPGAATYTLTATDGIITHSATYTLNVTIK